MKKTALFKVLVLVFACASVQNAFAQKGKDSYMVAAGAGSEFNMNARENFSGGVMVSLDFNLPSAPIAFGFAGAGNHNLSDTFAFEASLFFRWYLPGQGHNGFFLQVDGGFFYIMESSGETRETFPMPLGGLRAGFRIPLGKTFYIEPFGRGGYPFVFGVGLFTGFRF